MTADALVRALRPRPDRPVAFRLFATIVPLMLWTLYFVATHLRWGLALSPELWVGGVFFTGASGLALSLIMVPAAEPVTP